MLGTITFKVRDPKPSKRENNFSIIHKENFDIYNITFDYKHPEGYGEQKFYCAKVILNSPLNENNLYERFSEMVQIIRKIKLPAINSKQERVINHEVDVLMIYIANDILDVDEGSYEYRLVWENYENSYWKNSLVRDCKKIN